jgi:hypothetical protein
MVTSSRRVITKSARGGKNTPHPTPAGHAASPLIQPRSNEAVILAGAPTATLQAQSIERPTNRAAGARPGTIRPSTVDDRERLWDQRSEIAAEPFSDFVPKNYALCGNCLKAPLWRQDHLETRPKYPDSAAQLSSRSHLSKDLDAAQVISLNPFVRRSNCEFPDHRSWPFRATRRS